MAIVHNARFTSILICRFLIDLQQASIQDMHLGSRSPLGSQTTATNMTSLDFTRAMGAMGSVVTDEAEDETNVDPSLAETKFEPTGATTAEDHEVENRAVSIRHGEPSE